MHTNLRGGAGQPALELRARPGWATAEEPGVITEGKMTCSKAVCSLANGACVPCTVSYSNQNQVVLSSTSSNCVQISSKPTARWKETSLPAPRPHFC